MCQPPTLILNDILHMYMHITTHTRGPTIPNAIVDTRQHRRPETNAEYTTSFVLSLILA